MTTDYRLLLELERLIHEPARLVIMAILYTVESADFVYLMHETGLTQGNLSSHLAKLEEAGYIRLEKTFNGKFPRTLCQQTEVGRLAFEAYRAHLRLLFEESS
ncbi:MAG TPA: transcriptional regulator [Aggregatilineaceae bacterium]|nr:transcriptional regulator [Aggregatilineaceae bacterium]